MLALVLLVPAPSVGAALALWPAEPSAAGKAAFALAKVWVVVLPVCWLLLVDGQRPGVPGWSWRGIPAALGSGTVIFAAIVAAYWLAGVQWGWIDADLVRQRAAAAGLSTPTIFMLGALYWCTINAILEEYIWRWFVFSRCEMLMPRAAAVLASALFFTLHHVVALRAYFDWRVTVLASLGVLIGGAAWSWLYLRYRNIWAPYVSHLLADLAVFGVGYWIIFVR